MTRDEFANVIKGKYPEYNNIDNNQLVDSILAKYPDYKSQITEQPVQTTSQNSGMGDVAKQAIQTALPSEKAFEPVVPTDMTPKIGDVLKGATQSALDTLRDPTRISPTMSLPGQVAAESDIANKTNSALEDTAGISPKISKFVEAALLDPQTYIGLQPGSIPKGVQKQLANLGEVLSGVDSDSFMKLANSPKEVLSAKSSAETGKIFQAAKEAAGVTTADERALATNERLRGSFYRKTMDKIDAFLAEQKQPGRDYLAVKAEAPERVNAEGMGTDELAPIRTGAMQKGDVITLKSTNSELPDIKAVVDGTVSKDSKELSLRLQEAIPETDPAKLAKWEQMNKQFPDIPVTGSPVRHPANSNVGQSALEDLGYAFPKQAEPPTVAELLKVKKAGQLISDSNPSARGIISQDIKNKVNPLLKQLAPDVAEAQYQNHLSHVKEAFMQIFPQGKGMYKYFRTLGMLGGSLFHGIGTLESPVVAGALTLAGSQGAKAVLSPAGLFTLSKTLPQNQLSGLQSLRDKLINQQKEVSYKDSKYAD